MLTSEQMKETATNLRKMASDPRLKIQFSSETRKLMNDLANKIIASLQN
jgi:Trm5-related predicted tRNA methylase